jgi:ubiquitin-protein ligase
MADLNRVRKELVDVSKSWESAGVVASPISDSDLTHLAARIRGPVDTPYEGGVFHVDIVLPRE